MRVLGLALMSVGLAAQGPPPGVVVKDLDLTDMIVIEGKKDPSKIPQWIAWQTALGLIQSAHDGGYTDEQGVVHESAFMYDLKQPSDGRAGLSPQEWALLDAEGQRFGRVQAEWERAGLALQVKYGNQDWTDPAVYAKVDPQVRARADAEGWANDLHYRREILAARDRLLNAFSVDSQILLMTWVEENKESITTYVSKGDTRFWQPE